MVIRKGENIMGIIREKNGKKELVLNYKNKEIIFGTANEFIESKNTIQLIKNNFYKGNVSFYCETEEDVAYVYSLISKELLMSQNSLMEEGLPIYIGMEEKHGFWGPFLAKEPVTFSVENVKDFIEEEKMYRTVSINDLCEIDFE